MSKRGYSLVIGSVAMLLFASLRKVIPLHNVAFYMVCCIVFFCTAMAGYAVLSKRERHASGTDRPASSDRYVQGIQAVVALVIVIWIAVAGVTEVSAPWALEKSELIRRTFPLPLWTALMAAGVAGILFLLHREQKEQTVPLRQKIRAAVSVLFAVGTAVQFYAPNILEDVQGNIYHSHAYTSTIINVAWQVPYSHKMVSNYGHYGILYLPFLRAFHKFFSLDYITSISLVCAVLQGISVLAFAYVLNYFAKRDEIFYPALLGIGEYYFMLMKGGVYHQVHPHRIFFPMILILLVLKEQTKRKYHSILAIVLLTLSIVWSTEVGMVLMMSYALYRWMDQAYDGLGLTWKKCADVLKKLLLFALLPFAAAYAVVNLYNLLAGGEWLSFADYMFPLITEKGYLSLIELELPAFYNVWTGNAVLFLCAVTATMIPVIFPGRVRGEAHSVIFFMGITGAGALIYYINRPVEGCLFINLYIILILLAVILQKAQDVYCNRKENKQNRETEKGVIVYRSLRVIAAFLLFMMAFDSVYSMPAAWKASKETIWKRQELLEFAEYIGLQVPPDAVSFGMAVPEILSVIDRDTHSHTTDWGIHDMSDDVLQEVRWDLEAGQWLFCNMQSLYEMEQKFPGLSDQYDLLELMEYKEYQFGLWKRKGGQ